MIEMLKWKKRKKKKYGMRFVYIFFFVIIMDIKNKEIFGIINFYVLFYLFCWILEFMWLVKGGILGNWVECIVILDVMSV